jgi:hypothetical protein
MSNHLVIPKNTAAASFGQTYRSYSASSSPQRQLNIWYSNLELKPIFVAITFIGRGGDVYLREGLNESVIQIHGRNGQAEDENVSVMVSFYVPVNYYYYAECDFGYRHWVELR